MTIIKPKIRITMKPNNFTFYILSALGEPGKAPKCRQNLFMQNEPNFQRTMQTITLMIAGSYNEKNVLSTKNNEPKTNPIEPNSSPKTAPTNPIEPKANPIRTQTNPISNRLSMHPRGLGI